MQTLAGVRAPCSTNVAVCSGPAICMEVVAAIFLQLVIIISPPDGSLIVCNYLFAEP